MTTAPGIVAALAGLVTILGAATLVWMISVRLRDASVADLCWGLGFVRCSASHYNRSAQRSWRLSR